MARIVKPVSGSDEAGVPIGARAVFRKTVSEADVYLYAGVTGDFSPNHLDEEYMRGGRYGRRIAHGTLLLGFMSAASARLPLGRTVSLGYDRVRFTAPVFFGDTIETVYTVREYDEQRRRVYSELTCTNQHGQVVAVAVNIRKFVD
ncbi:MaoC family dehydratase [bacterium]|nr:MAG: MaoC family dehydratase [bacterium]